MEKKTQATTAPELSVLQRVNTLDSLLEQTGLLRNDNIRNEFLQPTYVQAQIIEGRVLMGDIQTQKDSLAILDFLDDTLSNESSYAGESSHFMQTATMFSTELHNALKQLHPEWLEKKAVEQRKKVFKKALKEYKARHNGTFDNNFAALSKEILSSYRALDEKNAAEKPFMDKVAFWKRGPKNEPRQVLQSFVQPARAPLDSNPPFAAFQLTAEEYWNSTQNQPDKTPHAQPEVTIPPELHDAIVQLVTEVRQVFPSAALENKELLALIDCAKAPDIFDIVKQQLIQKLTYIKFARIENREQEMDAVIKSIDTRIHNIQKLDEGYPFIAKINAVGIDASHYFNFAFDSETELSTQQIHEDAKILDLNHLKSLATNEALMEKVNIIYNAMNVKLKPVGSIHEEYRSFLRNTSRQELSALSEIFTNAGEQFGIDRLNFKNSVAVSWKVVEMYKKFKPYLLDPELSQKIHAIESVPLENFYNAIGAHNESAGFEIARTIFENPAGSVDYSVLVNNQEALRELKELVRYLDLSSNKQIADGILRSLAHEPSSVSLLETLSPNAKRNLQRLQNEIQVATISSLEAFHAIAQLPTEELNATIGFIKNFDRIKDEKDITAEYLMRVTQLRSVDTRTLYAMKGFNSLFLRDVLNPSDVTDEQFEKIMDELPIIGPGLSAIDEAGIEFPIMVSTYFQYEADITRALSEPQILSMITELSKVGYNYMKIDDVRSLISLSQYKDTALGIIQSLHERANFKFDTRYISDLLPLFKNPALFDLMLDLDYQHYLTGDVEKYEVLYKHPETIAFAKKLITEGYAFDIKNLEALYILSQNPQSVSELLKNNEAKNAFFSHIDLFKYGIPKEPVTFVNIAREISSTKNEEIAQLKDAFLARIAKSEQPVKEWSRIKRIFEGRTLPSAMKYMELFHIGMSDEQIEKQLKDHSLSPELIDAGVDKVREIMLKDVVKIHIENGNSSMDQFLQSMDRGTTLLTENAATLTSLHPNEQKTLSEFLEQCEDLYENMYRRGEHVSRPQSSEITVESLKKRIDALKRRLSALAPLETSIENQMNAAFLKPLGIESAKSGLEQRRRSLQNVTERNKQNAESGRMSIDAFDRLTGVPAQYLPIQMQVGLLCNELLFGKKMDLTPFDIDTSRVMQSDLTEPDIAKQFQTAIKNAAASKYGYGTLLMIKDRGQFRVTTNDRQRLRTDGAGPLNVSDRSRYESFYSAADNGPTDDMQARHFGIRSGISFTEVDSIIMSDDVLSNQSNIQQIKNFIALNGYYVPIINEVGFVQFTYDEYEQLRNILISVEGASQEIEIQRVDSHSLHATEIKSLAFEIAENHEKTKQISETILTKIKEVLMAYPEMRYARVHETGSTARATNIPGNADFDFMISIKVIGQHTIDAVAKSLSEVFQSQLGITYTEGNALQLRLPNSQGVIPDAIDVDIGIVSGAEVYERSTDEVIKQKLDTIGKANCTEAKTEVCAQIVLAKKMLKQAGAYKAGIIDGEGGLGGIGVESWILAHKGNLDLAFRSFYEAANRNGSPIPITEFSSKYRILSAGINKRTQAITNYTNGLSPEAYTKMFTMIKNYLSIE